MKEPEMELIAMVSRSLTHIGDARGAEIRKQVAELAARFPIYESRHRAAATHAASEIPGRQPADIPVARPFRGEGFQQESSSCRGNEKPEVSGLELQAKLHEREKT